MSLKPVVQEGAKVNPKVAAYSYDTKGPGSSYQLILIRFEPSSWARAGPDLHQVLELLHYILSDG